MPDADRASAPEVLSRRGAIRASAPSAAAAPGLASLAAPFSAGGGLGTTLIKRRCHRGRHAEGRAADVLECIDLDRDLALPHPDGPLVAGRLHGRLDGCNAALDNRADCLQSCRARTPTSGTPL